MPRYNIANLRKDAGMTQQELARRLNLSQGFLSSVETGRNPFPTERIDDLKNIFPDIDLENYLLDDTMNRYGYEVGNNNNDCQIHINDPEALKALISVMSSQNPEERNPAEVLSIQIGNLFQRIDKLNERNERLMDKIEKANMRIYELMEENNRLIKLLSEQRINLS